MFFFKSSKKELDITDALKRKEATITIGGKPVVIKAAKLSQAIDLIAALGNVIELLKLASADITLFNRTLLLKLPIVLKFALPEEQINPEVITLTEFADLIMAVWCVNDLERIVSNFTKATASIQKLTQGLAPLPKQ